MKKKQKKKKKPVALKSLPLKGPTFGDLSKLQKHIADLSNHQILIPKYDPKKYMNWFDGPGLGKSITARDLSSTMSATTQHLTTKKVDWADLRVLDDYTQRKHLIDSHKLMMQYIHSDMALSASLFDKGLEVRNEYGDALFEHKHYFVEGQMPEGMTCYDPDFLADFLWGPNWEWLGEVPTRDVLEEIQRHRQYTNNLYTQNYTFSEYDAIPLRNGECIVRYKNYSRKMKDRISGDNSELVLLIAAFIQHNMWDNGRVEEWLDMMTQKRFNFGYGVLRDGDDNYDPFGVLAEINDFKWKWVESEGAYSIGGNVQALDTESLSVMLGFRSTMNDYMIHRFARELTQIADSSDSFSSILVPFKEARAVVQSRQNALDRALRGLPVKYYQKRDNFYAPTVTDSIESSFITKVPDLKIDPVRWESFKEEYMV